MQIRHASRSVFAVLRDPSMVGQWLVDLPFPGRQIILTVLLFLHTRAYLSACIRPISKSFYSLSLSFTDITRHKETKDLQTTATRSETHKELRIIITQGKMRSWIAHALAFLGRNMAPFSSFVLQDNVNPRG